MSARRSTVAHQVLRSRSGESDSLPFLGEEPLLIRINDKPYLVVMRTPGEELYQALGFCLGEGIIDTPDDVVTTGYDEHHDPNLVDIWLTPERCDQVCELLERRRFVSQTSCGICGKEMLEDLHQSIAPAEERTTVSVEQIFACLSRLDADQQYYLSTRCSHASLLFDEQGEVIAFAEDVGRHNALDKAIGKAFDSRTLARARLLVLSSRNSYELIQKAARARLEIIVSKSRPTALAVAMGKALNLTLAFPDGKDLVIVCGENRIVG